MPDGSGSWHMVFRNIMVVSNALMLRADVCADVLWAEIPVSAFDNRCFYAAWLRPVRWDFLGN